MTADKITFEQLTDSQKQIIAESYVDKIAFFSLENALVEYVLNSSNGASLNNGDTPFTFEDITNFESTGLIEINGYQVELTEDEKQEKLEFFEYLRDKWEDYHNNLVEIEHTLKDFNKVNNAYNKFLEIDSLCEELENLECEDYPEIYQWFYVDSDTLHKLEEKGECTLDGSFWGRQCCGQSITLDRVIQLIAFEHYTEYNTNYITQETIENNKFNASVFWN